MANCGDTYVFFDPLGSSVSMLSSNSQTLAPHNGCQEVVSKGGLDRFVKPTQSSITLTVNTLGENNKNHQLSRRSKCKPAKMFKNEGPMNPDFGEITQQLCTLINDNLEAMAKQLYDYWFVQFDFPNEEGKPYKSSGGAMVWNEKLKREIPQGWTAAKIKDVAQTYSGGTPTSTNSEYYDGGDIPWINSGELNNPIITSTTNYITEEGLNNSSAKLYPQDTVLVALYGATAGKVSLLSFEACSNQAVCGVIPQNKIMTTYIRYYLSSLYEHFITLSSGSARDNISQDTIKNTIFPIPQGKILKEFSDAVAPIISKIIANQKEMENLTKQRDELLPLLMNGQATVNSD